MRNQPISLDGSPLTIEAAQQNSGHMDFRRKPLRGIIIHSSGLTPVGTITIEVSENLSEEVVTWESLQSGGANVVVGAREAVPLDFLCWEGLRLHSDSAAETADLIYRIRGLEE